MSTPISEGLRAAAILAAAQILSAIPAAAEAIVVAGPEGWCLEDAARGEFEAGGFALLGACEADDAGAVGAARPAILSVHVADPYDDLAPPPDTDAMAAFLSSEAGQAALAPDGDPASVEVLWTRTHEGAVLLGLRDLSDARAPGLAELTWRAVLPLRGRLVALSVNGHAEAPLTEAAAREVLDAFLAAMRAANPERQAAGG